MENLGSLNLRLTAADLAELESGYAKIQIHGGRMKPLYNARHG
jgi:hypothetical protein